MPWVLAPVSLLLPLFSKNMYEHADDFPPGCFLKSGENNFDVSFLFLRDFEKKREKNICFGGRGLLRSKKLGVLSENGITARS
jgi:hypothetical protein